MQIVCLEDETDSSAYGNLLRSRSLVQLLSQKSHIAVLHVAKAPHEC